MKNRLLTFGLLLMLAGIFASCKKEHNNYDLTVIVTVYDTVPVANAAIHLYAPVSGTFIDYYDNANESGEKDYHFNNKVIVQIQANKGSFKGCNFAEVNRGQNTVYVDVKPFGVNENGCNTGL